MAISIKICGITNAEAADAAVAAGAVFGGLVFHPRSPRDRGPKRPGCGISSRSLDFVDHNDNIKIPLITKDRREAGVAELADALA